MKRYIEIDSSDKQQTVPIKAWVRGVPLDPKAEQQLRKTAQLPFIHRWMRLTAIVLHRTSIYGYMLDTYLKSLTYPEQSL